MLIDNAASEVRCVLQLRKIRRRVRPWIAMVAAYAFALQLLLTGVAAAQVAATGSLPGDLLVICHSGDGQASDQDGTGKTPLAQSPCALCTLTSAPCAIPSTTVPSFFGG
jgi:hypothetical protein